MLMPRKSVGVIIGVLAAIVTLAVAVTSAGAGAKQKPLVIGISSRTWTSPPLKDAGLQAVAEAKRRGGIKVVFALTDDGPGQVTAVETLLAKKVDILAIDPNDDKAIVPAIKEANKAGVPVIMWVGGVKQGKVAQTIVTSETKGGALIGAWVFKKLGGKGKVALEQGDASHPAGRAREDGFRAALKKYPNIELSNYGEGEWVRDTGESTAANFLTRTPDLQAIVALNDEMALGALTAVKGASSKAMVTGYNGQCTALQSIWQGGLTSLLYQPFAQMGQVIVDTAAKIHAGKKVPKIVELPEVVVDKAYMKRVQSGSIKVNVGLKTSVRNAVKGCK
jgi:ABC-type sugar transport system substrate-binding protein